jgi:hypothetical protein
LEQDRVIEERKERDQALEAMRGDIELMIREEYEQKW